jgi:hypothetical protein
MVLHCHFHTLKVSIRQHVYGIEAGHADGQSALGDAAVTHCCYSTTERGTKRGTHMSTSSSILMRVADAADCAPQSEDVLKYSACDSDDASTTIVTASSRPPVTLSSHKVDIKPPVKISSSKQC